MKYGGYVIIVVVVACFMAIYFVSHQEPKIQQLHEWDGTDEDVDLRCKLCKQHTAAWECRPSCNKSK